MFLQTPNKPVRLTTAAKARAGLNTHSHKIESIEARKRSPDVFAGPPSPSSSNDVMVFTNSYHGRSGHNSRSLPEYPNIDEMQRYVQDVWDQKMRELNDPNSKLKYLNLGKPNDKMSYRKEGSPTSSQPPTPVKQRSSPQHNNSNSTNGSSSNSSHSNSRKF